MNGHYDERLSTLSGLPRGVHVMSLATALADTPSTLEPHIGRAASGENAAFVALNTAFFQDGAFIYVPANKAVAEPVQLVFLSTGRDSGATSHPRNLIVRDGGLTACDQECERQARNDGK